MFQISVDRLTKDELEYELRVRGISDKGNVDSLRKHFRSILTLEKAGGPLQGKVELDPAVEISECGKKLLELRDNIASFAGTTNQAKKIETKFAHLMSRIGRIPESDEDISEERSKLLISLSDLVPEYTNKSKLFESKDSPTPAFPCFSGTQSQTPTSPSNTNQSAQSDSNSTSRIQHSSATVSSHHVVKSIPVYKWDIKFSGSGMSFNSFLQRVEELRKSRHVTHDELFLSAHDLFEGDALNFYHMISKHANDWDSLISLMREQFVPPHIADQLWKQILGRTQGVDESVGLYVAAMTKLFDRMPTPVSDDIRLKVLRANILPFYQERLALQTVDSPFELIELCRKLEETKINVEQYVPPRRGNLSLEPDLDYHSSRRENKPVVREIAANDSPDLDVGAGSNRPSGKSSSRLCFKCDQPNHIARHCTSNIIRCFKCKKVGFTKRNCPNCSSSSGNGSRGRS